MGISVLTIQDEPDGSVTLSFTTEPHVETDTQGLTNAQTLGLMCFHDLREALQAEIVTDGDEEPAAT